MLQPEMEKLHERLDDIILRMQKIQREIRASRQPMAGYELAELKRLGLEYTAIVASLEQAGEENGNRGDAEPGLRQQHSEE